MLSLTHIMVLTYLVLQCECFVTFFLSFLPPSPPVPEYFVRSSELHHGEGGEHPPIQPLAPAHAHLDGLEERPHRHSYTDGPQGCLGLD